MNRPCYALSTLLTVLAGFSSMVAPATGKAPNLDQVRRSESVCLVVEEEGARREISLLTSTPVDPPTCPYADLYDTIEDSAALFAWDQSVEEPQPAVDPAELPHPADRPPAPAADATAIAAAGPSEGRRTAALEEYSPYDIGCEAMGAGLPCWSHEITEAGDEPLAEVAPAAPRHEGPPQEARPTPAAPVVARSGQCLLGRQRALWDAPYRFSFDELEYTLAGEGQEDAPAAAELAAVEPAAIENAAGPEAACSQDRPPTPLWPAVVVVERPRAASAAPAPAVAATPEIAKLAEEMNRAWESFGYRFENGRWLPHAAVRADLAPAASPAAEGAAEGAASAALESETVSEQTSSETGDAELSDAGTEAAIDEAIARAWDEVDALYNAWRESERQAAAPSWGLWGRCQGGLNEVHRRLDPQSLHAAWEGLDLPAATSWQPPRPWTELAISVSEGLRRHAEREQAEQQARQSMIALLRSAAVGMKQASGILEGWAEAWDGRLQAGQPDQDIRR